uniref:Uncharacterized protein n=1 Tax=Anguilla anguilla TaxID=7936 RepID=A0A0E9XD50_ANGAN
MIGIIPPPRPHFFTCLIQYCSGLIFRQ